VICYMARSNSTKKITRIQREKMQIILDAALDVFSNHGFRGATIDMIAEKANLSKPNILYYFDSKDKIHEMLLSNLLETWLEPLKQISPKGEPITEICCYVERKLEMARDYPKESRLFANEILQGAPRILHALNGPLKKLTDEKATIINSWISDKRINSVEPYHLIFSIWAITQHYADFDVQILAVMGKNNAQNRFDDANKFLKELFTRLLEPKVKLKEPLL
jgi:TetR/AcrR family transcriptional regulator